MTYRVIRIRNGHKVVFSEHLTLPDAKIKAQHIRGTVIVDQHGKVVPYDAR